MTKIAPKHVLAFLLMFWAAWLYTEVSEFLSRENFEENVNDFMGAGDRNTRHMGKALCERVAHLESEHHSTEHDPDCTEIYKGDNNGIPDSR